MSLEPTGKELRRLEGLAGVVWAGATVQPAFFKGPVGIRPFHIGDAPALLGAIRESLPELTSWMLWCHGDYSSRDATAFLSSCASSWQRGERYSFAIFDRNDGTLLGSVGLSSVNRVHGFANLGYWIRTSRAGHGAGSAAIVLAARFAFGELGLHRLELVVPVGNVPSRRAAEKAGAQPEGILRKRLRLRGKSHDAVLYSLIADDLRT